MNSSLYLLISVVFFLTLFRNSLAVKKANFLADNLKCQNKYRSKHQVSKLEYTPELQTAAQKYADQLAALDGGLKHEKGSIFGENLYCGFGKDVKGIDACEAWYNESKYYDYNRSDPNNFSQIGHFTQMVWKGTKATGIGMAKSRTGKTYIVAKYSPPGNYMGEYKANVLPPK